MFSRDRSVGARWVYSGLVGTLLPIALPLVCWHPRTRGWLRERLGFVPRGERPAPIWFHGASVGDLAALRPLVVRTRRAGVPAVVSCWTRAARRAASSWNPDQSLFMAPIDLCSVSRRVLRRLGPQLLVLEGLEIWPNLLASCRELRVPVVIVNGRLSADSLRRYRRYGRLFGSCFATLSRVVALDQANAQRFVQAGVPAERVTVCPSSKHLDLLGGGLGIGAQRGGRLGMCEAEQFTLVMGSLHWQEAKLLLPRVAQFLHRYEWLRVIIAPRYPATATRMRRLLARHRISSAVSSEGSDARVVVQDVFGALRGAYQQGTVAFVGGSLIARGGHNVIEPAALGVPVLTGPYHRNCRSEVALLCSSGGGFVVQDGPQFARTLEVLLSSGDLCQLASTGAFTAVSRLAGHVQCWDDVLGQLLATYAGSRGGA